MGRAVVNSALVVLAALALGSAVIHAEATSLVAQQDAHSAAVADGPQLLVQVGPSLRSRGARQLLAPRPTKKRPTKKTAVRNAAPNRRKAAPTRKPVPTKKATARAVPKKPPPPPPPKKKPPPPPVKKPPPPPVKRPPPPQPVSKPPPPKSPPPPAVGAAPKFSPPPVVAAAPITPPPPAAPEIETIMVRSHNNVRSRHQATGNLTWDSSLATAAQGWAEGCHGITHSYQPGKGENTYFSFATAPEALGTPAFNFQDAVDSWYSEIEFWNFTTGMNKEGFETADSGHFTQVIWTDTIKVGCGSSYCPGPGNLDGTDYPYGFVVICQYLPPGNVNGPDNYILHVKPLK